MKSLCTIAAVLAINLLVTVGLAEEPTPSEALSVADDLRQQLARDPRGAVTDIYRSRILDRLMVDKQYQAAAELALACINGQPDRLDRVEWFLALRIRALLAMNRNDQALAAAKSFYNVASIHSTDRAIELLAQCLSAAYPDDPAIVKRFKLQQLGGHAPNPAERVLSQIIVDPAIYDGKGLVLERNRDWRRLGEGNLALLRDKPSEARAIFQRLCDSPDERVRQAARESLARAVKAESGSIRAANEILLAAEERKAGQ